MTRVRTRVTTDRPRARGPGRGLSLIEVLVVIVLMAVALLGLVALQARAQQVSVNAEDSHRAALLAQDLAAAMWAAKTLSLPADTITAWNAQVANPAGRGLPSGSGTVSVAVSGGVSVATITVSWSPPQAPSGTTHRYVTNVVLPP